MGGLLTALIAAFQVISQVVPPIGPAAINLTLIPIVIGAVMYGPAMATWLGFVSAFAILVTPSTVFFYDISWYGTAITVLTKGIVSGACAAYVYKLVGRINRFLGVLAASIVCPVVNTGIFTIGCLIFFNDHFTEMSSEAGVNILYFIIVLYVGWNFVLELVANVALSPTTTKIIDLASKKKKK